MKVIVISGYRDIEKVKFKINACKTLINRTYKICSNWSNVTKDFNFLENYFKQNCFPDHIFTKQLKSYLDNIFKPKPTVAKDIKYFYFPFLGHL